jgi:hypothetical protein
MEDDLQEIIQPIQVKTNHFLKMEDGLKSSTIKSSKNNSIFENGRQPQSLFEKGKRPQINCNRKQLKVNGCGTAPGNLVSNKIHVS